MSKYVYISNRIPFHATAKIKVTSFFSDITENPNSDGLTVAYKTIYIYIIVYIYIYIYE